MKIQTKTGAVIAAGRLKKNDPVEYREVGQNGTPLASFGLMVERGDQQRGTQPVWLNCKAWRDLAKKIAVCPGGADVLVAGHVETETWTGRDGQQHSSEVCTCEFIAMASFASESKVPYEKPHPADVTAPEWSDDPDGTGGDLPF